MKLSEAIIQMTAVLAAEGDVNVFAGDMVPLNAGHFDVVEAQATDNVDEAQLYGKRYLHLGEW
jgi:hypothetical protein